MTSRDQVRSRRFREVRSHTENVKRISKKSLRVIDYPDGVERPRTRGECWTMERPCPFVSCRHHLYLEVNPNGNIKYNFPDLAPDELIESCALDVAELGPWRLEDVAEIMNLTRERVRQIQIEAMSQLQADSARLRKEVA
jgi:hypothetical protein